MAYMDGSQLDKVRNPFREKKIPLPRNGGRFSKRGYGCSHRACMRKVGNAKKEGEWISTSLAGKRSSNNATLCFGRKGRAYRTGGASPNEGRKRMTSVTLTKRGVVSGIS